MQNYENAEIKIIPFDSKDVITSSTCPSDCPNET